VEGGHDSDGNSASRVGSEDRTGQDRGDPQTLDLGPWILDLGPSTFRVFAIIISITQPLYCSKSLFLTVIKLILFNK
jgi:hypothetical protein